MLAAMLQSLTPAAQLRGGRLARRLTQLLVGLSLFGVSNTLLLRANLGLDPWNVFHQGLTLILPLSLGQAIVAVGLVVLLGWIPLRQWPGLGTIANVLWVGVATDLVLGWIPELGPDPLSSRILAFAAGIVISALAASLYIGSQLGPGPRDGIMTGFSMRYGVSIRSVRTVLELFALVSGWLMGGEFGLGTVVYALSIGPLVQFFLAKTIVPVEVPSEVPKSP